MKKIVAFGDSFIKSGGIDNWVTKLGMLANLPVMNYGVSGSSINYSLNEFARYATSSDYNEDDIIIYVVSDTTRLHLGKVDHADSNVMFHKKPFGLNGEKFIDANFENIMWCSEHIHSHMTNIEDIKTLSFIRTWSKSHPNLVVVLRGFSSKVSNDLAYLLKPTENFFPLFGKSLVKISFDEVVEKNRKKILGSCDMRTNHFCRQNLDLMSRMVYDVLQSKSIDRYDDSRFAKDVFADWDLENPIYRSLW